MKKLLLGLGTSLLAVIPLAAVVSCSSSVTPTLETEAAKFATSKTTTPANTSGSAAKSITDATDATAKLAALKGFVTVPTLATGFTFEVKSAAVATVKTSVDVKITVTETESKKTKDVTFVVTGLKEQTALEAEAAKFAIPVVTTTPTTTSTAAALTITSATGAEAKLTALKVFATLPTVPETFSVTVTAAEVASVTTSVNVSITITEVTTPANTTNVTFVVTGLVSVADAQTKLVEQAALLVNKEALVTTDNATAAAAKITSSETLKTYYAEVTMSEGITYAWKSTTAGTGDKSTIVIVVVTVSSNVSGTTPIDKTIELSGFAAASL